jgi:hypothetical protein
MKDSPTAWIIMIGGLFAVQTWIVPMMINQVTGTELLKGTAEQGGSASPVSNDQTRQAFAICNSQMKERQQNVRLSFPPEPDRSWDVGFGRYMIRASVEVDNGEQPPEQRDYLCHARFNGGANDDPDNWSVDGIEIAQR